MTHELLNFDDPFGIDVHTPLGLDEDLCSLLEVDFGENSVSNDIIGRGSSSIFEGDGLNESFDIKLDACESTEGSDSGFEHENIKQEPLSPAESEASTDSGFNQLENILWSSGPIDNSNIIKLETTNSPTSHPVVQQIFSLSPTSSSVCNVSIQDCPISCSVNNEVKIQPKPESNCPKVCNAAKPLVMSIEEFNKLTDKGFIQVQNDVQQSNGSVTLNKVVPMANKVYPVSKPPMASTGASIIGVPQTEADVKAYRRQQRMIKNRESACLSRKRKKEYMTQLEMTMQDFSNENEILKRENMALKAKIDYLQFENKRLKVVDGSNVLEPEKGKGQSPSIKKACLLTVMFLLSLNLIPFSGINLFETKSLDVYQTEKHSGRNLLFFDENNSDANVNKPLLKSPQFPIPSDLIYIRNSFTSNKMCPNAYFNATESNRLVEELTGWVLGHKKMIRKRQQRRSFKNIHRNRKLKAAETMKFNIKSKDILDPSNYRQNYQIQLFNGPDIHYNQLLDSINRRNDTFYVVSFRKDHLLLPATAHNKTARPKMSLLVPAMSLNSSKHAPPNTIAMMQIDCEVTHTQLLHIDKQLIPAENLAATRPHH